MADEPKTEETPKTAAGDEEGRASKAPPTGKADDTITKTRAQYDAEMADRAERASESAKKKLLAGLRELGLDVKDEAGLKEVAKKMKALEDEKKSDLEKLTARATEAEKRAMEAQAKAEKSGETAAMYKAFAQHDVADYELMEYLHDKAKAADPDGFDAAAFLAEQKADPKRAGMFKGAPPASEEAAPPAGKAPARTGAPPPKSPAAQQAKSKVNAMELKGDDLLRAAAAEGIDPGLFRT